MNNFDDFFNFIEQNSLAFFGFLFFCVLLLFIVITIAVFKKIDFKISLFNKTIAEIDTRSIENKENIEKINNEIKK